VFYLMFIPVSIALALELRYMWKLRRRDSVMFGFRRLRSEIMAYILENAEQFSPSDYLFARQLVNALDVSELAHQESRSRFFNARAFARFVRDFTASEAGVAGLPRPSSEALRTFETRFAGCLFNAFLAYTPFFASELLLRFSLQVLVWTLSLPSRLGIRAARTARSAYEGALLWVDRHADSGHGHGMHLAS
jgi:hypothetical protein